MSCPAIFRHTTLLPHLNLPVKASTSCLTELRLSCALPYPWVFPGNNRLLQVPKVLTVAGSDSGGGAGIQADLKTYQARGVFGASAISALTAQNTRGVRGVHTVPTQHLSDQMEAVLSDIGADVIKTGMLPTAEVKRRPLFHGINSFPAAVSLPAFKPLLVTLVCRHIWFKLVMEVVQQELQSVWLGCSGLPVCLCICMSV